MDVRFTTFLKLVETKNYTKTAEELYISQPSVTHHIKSIEKEFNCKLFIPNSKELKLSKSGEMFLDFVNKLNCIYNQFNVQIQNKDTEDKYYKFGTTEIISQLYLNDLLINWVTDFPNIKFDLKIYSNEKIMVALEEGKIDFAIIDFLYDYSSFKGILLKKSSYILLTSKNNPIVKKRKLSFSDLINEKWFINLKNENFLKALKEKNITLEGLKNISYVESDFLIKDLIVNGLGIACLPKEMVEEELFSSELVEIKVADFTIERNISFVFDKDSLFADNLEEMAKKIIRMKQNSIYKKYNILN